MNGRDSIYEIDQDTDYLRIRFSSSMSRIDDVCVLVSGFLEGRGPAFCAHRFAVNLVLREGLTNAVRHGNKHDKAKIVTMAIDIVNNSRMRIRIEDQGPGFDWKTAVQAPLCDAADHGRGLPIMNMYFDRYTFNDCGNCLTLEKDITKDPGTV